MKFKLSNIIYTIMLSFLFIGTLIVLFNARNLSDKPVIDVIITSFSGLISALLAALVAYYVAHLQIQHQVEEINKKKKHIYLSSLQLLSHEVQYNKQVLDTAVSEAMSDELSQFLKSNIAINIWDKVSLDIIQDLDQEVSNNISTFYYKVTMLKQGLNANPELVKQTFSLCVTIEAQIKTTLKEQQD